MDFLPAALARIVDACKQPSTDIRLVRDLRPRGPFQYGTHSHEGWEFFVPLQGVLHFQNAGRPMENITPQTCLLVEPGCLHMSVINIPQPADLQLLTVGFRTKNPGCGGILLGPGNQQKRHYALTRGDLLAWTELAGDPPTLLIERMARDLKRGTSQTQELAAGRLQTLFVACIGALAAPWDHTHATAERRANMALAYLESHCHEADLTVERLASALGISASHIANLFRRATGRSVHRALLDIRFRRAESLLRRGDLSIKEVSALTGWSNQLYFSAAFRKRYGIPPSAFAGQGRLHPADRNVQPSTLSDDWGTLAPTAARKAATF